MRSALRLLMITTTRVNSSLLQSKRVAFYQRGYEEMNGDFIRKYTTNSETLLTKLVEVVEKHGDADAKEDAMATVEAFIEQIEVELPKPDSATLETQMESFRNYSDALDMAIDAWISDEFAMMDAEGDMANNIRPLRAAVKAHFQRRWLRENNVFPELEEITQVDDKGEALFKFGELQDSHMSAVLSFVADYMEKARKAAAKRDEKLAKQQEELGDYAPSEGGDAGGFGGGGFGDSGGGFGDDSGGGFGGDDFGGGFGDFP